MRRSEHRFRKPPNFAVHKNEATRHGEAWDDARIALNGGDARAPVAWPSEKKQRSLYPLGQPGFARGGRVKLIAQGLRRLPQKEQQSQRQNPLVSIMKSDALMMTAAAVLASILISSAPHGSTIFGPSGHPRLPHTSKQTLRLWNRPSIVVHRTEVVLNPAAPSAAPSA